MRRRGHGGRDESAGRAQDARRREKLRPAGLWESLGRCWAFRVFLGGFVFTWEAAGGRSAPALGSCSGVLKLSEFRQRGFFVLFLFFFLNKSLNYFQVLHLMSFASVCGFVITFSCL